MPFINLIQEHVLAAKKERKRARTALFCFTLAVVMAGGANAYCIWQSESLDSDIAKLKADTDKNKEQIAQIEQNRRELLDLAPRLKTLSDAQMMTKRWATILDHLSRQTPPGTWLTGMRTQGNDPTQPLVTSFQGLSNRQELVGEFILRLQACSDLENVSLKFTQEKIVSNGKGIEFDVSANIVGTAEAKPKNEQKEAGN